MVVLKVINTAVKERLLDLRGREMSSIEDLGGTEDEFDTIDLSENMIAKLENFPCLNRLGTLVASDNRINYICSNIGELLPKLHTLVLMSNDITTLAEIDPLAALPNLKSLYLLENPVTETADYRLYVIHMLKHLMSLDFEKVKPQERTTAEYKFHSKEAREEVKKTSAKAYTPMKPVGAQYITEKSCPKAVSPVPSIKVLSTGQMAAEFAFFEPEIDMAEALEKTDKIKGQNHENRADEQMSNEESTLIQEVKVSMLNNWMIDIDQEIFGAGPDSIYVTQPRHMEEYIYKNFQQTPFRFILSWRKRLFKKMHILPLPRMQISAHTWTLNYIIYDIPLKLCACCAKHS
ncbi:U2 small nuclear ribonucleoprotein A'-like isoform X2 [Triticum dicoccoides]|uniref:U2 small nuclear ribonucleoprotein A'-like isoform X2 n=1 Tax=Triticum dicoccoides TaxID=85692 RepID=UPI00188FD3FB|nr:U2 small nuclear ribonucleoprotein A'-like isoform X2 [Triticum dicoccoides]